MEETIRTILNYALIGRCGVIGWMFKTLQTKADKEEVAKLQDEVNGLRESMFRTLATKEDVNKLEVKIDKLIDRELAKNEHI